KRMATYSDYLAKLGRSLKSSVDSYNKAVGSFDTQLLPGARKFTEMGVIKKKEMADLEEIELFVKTPNKNETENE
ncbi:MAG: DNA recombination protein RmuC, partial [Gammaproteobacteria bacterium]